MRSRLLGVMGKCDQIVGKNDDEKFIVDRSLPFFVAHISYFFFDVRPRFSKMGGSVP